MEFTLTQILEYPLPLAFLIYLTICTIILYTKPAFLFPPSNSNSNGNNDGKEEEENYGLNNSNKNLWLFFIILAVVIYVLISLLVSHVNRTNYLAMFLTPPKD
jgi:hypothetical protein